VGEKKIKQNALSQKVGDIYHYYIAIQLMFQNNSWDKCSIEQYGDIVLFDSGEKQILNVEVKHHLEEKELKIYEEEFQKTLSNWFDIKNLFNADTQLILMTSSIISSGNPLEYWNSFNTDKKYRTLLENQKKKNQTYYSNVKTYFLKINKHVDELKEVLSKFEVRHNLPNILKIRNEIKLENSIRVFDEETKKDKVIDELYSLIGRGLENKDKWEVTKVQFDQKLKELTTLIQEKTLRTDNNIKANKIDIKDYQEKQFIKKLEKIEFQENIFKLAIDDYAKSVIEIADRMHLSSSLEYDERLENYCSSLIRLVDEVKTEHLYETDLSDVKKSQKSYFQITKSKKIPFIPEEFNDQTTFFQKGYLHILADDEEKPKQVCWFLKPEDLI